MHSALVHNIKKEMFGKNKQFVSKIYFWYNRSPFIMFHSTKDEKTLIFSGRAYDISYFSNNIYRSYLYSKPDQWFNSSMVYFIDGLIFYVKSKHLTYWLLLVISSAPVT